jgi:hypothetical protein
VSFPRKKSGWQYAARNAKSEACRRKLNRSANL